MNLRRAALFAILALTLLVTWARPLDAMAERSVDAGLKRAVVAFAAARALNAVLSALQEASVSVQVGAGVSVKPGAVLEPLDDVVEQFSNVLFVASASFAVQRLMIGVFAAWPVCVLVSVLLVAWAAFALKGRAPPTWLRRAAVTLVLLRLAVPVWALAGEAVHALALAEPYRQSARELAVGDEGGGPAQETAPEGLWERTKRLLSQSSDVARQVETLKSRANSLVEHMIRMTAVFVLEVVVLPLLYLGLLLWTYRQLTRTRGVELHHGTGRLPGAERGPPPSGAAKP